MVHMGALTVFMSNFDITQGFLVVSCFTTKNMGTTLKGQRVSSETEKSHISLLPVKSVKQTMVEEVSATKAGCTKELK